MANKDRNKRSVRKARAAERARVEAAQATSAPQVSSSKKAAKEVATPKVVAKKETKPDKKPGIFKRFANYLGDVRSEMHRVVWPSKSELKSYSIAVVILLIVLGVIIWLVDTGVVAALVGYTGLRG